MATRKPKDDDGYAHDDGHRRPYKEESHAVDVHKAYLEHRLKGGEPASPEAYRRAIEQFQKLPGATQSTPAAVPKNESGDTTRDQADDGSKRGDER